MNSDCSPPAAHVLAICVDFKRSFGFHAEARGLKMVHFADAQVAAKIDCGKHAGELQRNNTTDKANGEMAIVDLRVRSNLHPVAVRRLAQSAPAVSISP